MLLKLRDVEELEGERDRHNHRRRYYGGRNCRANWKTKSPILGHAESTVRTKLQLLLEGLG